LDKKDKIEKLSLSILPEKSEETLETDEFNFK